MTVAPRGYRRWQPSGERGRPAWLVIADRTVRLPLRSRRFLLLLAAAWVPAVVKGGILYFTWRFGDLARLLGGGWAAVTPAGFLSFLDGQNLFVLLVLAVAGAGVVCDDRRDGGLALYLARPLDVREYVTGKAAGVLVFYLLVTLAPVLALCLFGYLVTSGATGPAMLLAIPLRATVYCLLAGASLSLLLTALSAASRRRSLVVVGWGLVLLGTPLLGRVVGLLRPALAVVDIPARYHDVGTLLLDGRTAPGVPVGVSAAVVVGLTLGAVLALRRQVRAVEVVA